MHSSACLFWEMLVICLSSQLVASCIYSCFLLGAMLFKGTVVFTVVLGNYKKLNTVDKQIGGNQRRLLNCTRTLYWIQNRKGDIWMTSKSMWEWCCCERTCLHTANSLGRLAANRRAWMMEWKVWKLDGEKKMQSESGNSGTHKGTKI